MTEFDVIKNSDFRNYVMKRISESTKNPYYNFPKQFPLLCRYTKLSKYSIEDIINERVTSTNIGEFNDIFDGALHLYNSKMEMDAIPEKKWNELKNIYQMFSMELSDKSHKEFIENQRRVLRNHNNSAFDMLENLGVFICCFSTQNDSTLMWSHYAGYNTGMCITYDFNQWSDDVLLKHLIFPIAYTDNPIIIPDIMQKTNECEYSVEANILCTALCKARVWDYEHEWRLFFLQSNEYSRRLPLNIKNIPVKVCFGFHFMKSFFYSNENESEDAKANIENFHQLLSYLIEKDIPVSIITSEIGGYNLIPKEIESCKLRQFISTHFKDNRPKQIKYYHVVQNKLFDLMEKE